MPEARPVRPPEGVRTSRDAAEKVVSESLIVFLFRQRLAADRIQHGYDRLYHGATLGRYQPDIVNQEVQTIAAGRQVADDEPRILRHALLGDQIRICRDEQRAAFT